MSSFLSHQTNFDTTVSVTVVDVLQGWPRSLLAVACSLSNCKAKISPLSYAITAYYSVGWSYAVAQLVEALCYKPEGRGFDSRWCHWNFSLTYYFRSQYGPGVDSNFNRNEYQGYFLGGKGGRCVRLTTLPPSCVDCLDICETPPPRNFRVCSGL